MTTTPTIASTIALIHDYTNAIIDDTASDSTLDDMQFDIDCILFRDDLDADMIEYASYDALTIDNPLDHHITPDPLPALRAYATAAFNLRP